MDRRTLLELAQVLNCRDSALRRDECGDWRIGGSKGHIYAGSEGFQIFVLGWSTKGWNLAKEALAFAKVTQDGDDEGGLILDRLPDEAEAALIRHWVRIPKKRDVSEETLSRLRQFSFRAGTHKNAPESPSTMGRDV
jgi:hypothetical protein